MSILSATMALRAIHLSQPSPAVAGVAEFVASLGGKSGPAPVKAMWSRS